MQGGRIIGEGVDGCVLSEPLWPCSADSIKGRVPSVYDKNATSKVILKNDMESLYRKSAQQLLGPLAPKFMTILQGECAPADSRHPPPRSQEAISAYTKSKESLLKWENTGNACETLKTLVKKNNSISDTHKIIYVSKYLMNVKEWLITTKQPIEKIIQSVIPAIRPFLEALQMLYQQENMQLIHIDLHIGNIFVNPATARTPLQFGLSDFGNCFLRRTSDTKEVQANNFFGKYLCEHIAVIPTLIGYSQVPLEAKLLHYCFTKQLESISPGSFAKSWEFDVIKSSSYSNDIIEIEVTVLINNLLKRPLFIAILENIQHISKKLRANLKDKRKVVQSLTPGEQVVLEFILTRYGIISPINTITEGLVTLSLQQNESKQVQLSVHSYFGKKNIHSKLRNNNIELAHLINFLLRSITAPYDQVGSSLSAALASVQGGDLRIIWDDIVTSA